MVMDFGFDVVSAVMAFGGRGTIPKFVLQNVLGHELIESLKFCFILLEATHGILFGMVVGFKVMNQIRINTLQFFSSFHLWNYIKLPIQNIPQSK